MRMGLSPVQQLSAVQGSPLALEARWDFASPRAPAQAEALLRQYHPIISSPFRRYSMQYVRAWVGKFYMLMGRPLLPVMKGERAPRGCWGVHGKTGGVVGCHGVPRQHRGSPLHLPLANIDTALWLLPFPATASRMGAKWSFLGACLSLLSQKDPREDSGKKNKCVKLTGHS